MKVTIGIDPHKGSHTAVAIDSDEASLALGGVRQGCAVVHICVTTCTMKSSDSVARTATSPRTYRMEARQEADGSYWLWVDQMGGDYQVGEPFELIEPIATEIVNVALIQKGWRLSRPSKPMKLETRLFIASPCKCCGGLPPQSGRTARTPSGVVFRPPVLASGWTPAIHRSLGIQLGRGTGP